MVFGRRKFSDAVLGIQIATCYRMSVPVQSFIRVSLLIRLLFMNLTQMISCFITAQAKGFVQVADGFFSILLMSQTLQMHQTHPDIGLWDFLLLSQSLINLIGTFIVRMLRI